MGQLMQLECPTRTAASLAARPVEGFCAGWAILGLAVWLASAWMQAVHKMPSGDEVDLLLSLEALHATGNTVFTLDAWAPPHPANWHPPLYWVVAVLPMSWGLSALASALLVNFLACLATVALTAWLGYRCVSWTNPELARAGALGSVGFLCSLPLFQMAPGLVDLDNALLALLVAGFLAALVLGAGRGRFQVILLGVLLGLCLLTKLTTPLLLPAAAWLALRRNRSWLEACRTTALVVLLGVAVFAVGYGLTRPLFGGPWYAPLLHTFGRFVHPPTGPAIPLKRWYALFTLVEVLLWLGPLSVVLGVGLVFSERRFVRQALGDPRLQALAFVVLMVFMGYTALGVRFNVRYFVPALPACAVLFSILLCGPGLQPAPAGRPGRELVWLGLSAALALALLPEPVLYLKTVAKEQLGQAVLRYGLRMALFLAGTFAAAQLLGRARCSQLVLRTLFIGWVAANVGTSLRQIWAGYDLHYSYGAAYADRVEIVRWLRDDADPAVPVVVPHQYLFALRSGAHPMMSERTFGELGPLPEWRKVGHYYRIVAGRTSLGFEHRLDTVLRTGRRVYERGPFIILDCPAE